MKYVVVSRHSEDVGLGRPIRPGQTFDDKDVPDHMKERVKALESQGRIVKPGKKTGGE